MIINVIGWVGTVMVVLAYLLVNTEKLHPKDLVYNLLNFFGAIFIGVNVYHNQAWPALGLQLVWGIVAVISLFKYSLRLNTQNRR